MSRRRVLELFGAAVAAASNTSLAAERAAVSAAVSTTVSAAEPVAVRVAVNRGAENQTLLALLEQQGFARALGVTQALVAAATPPATLEALLDERADVCVVSAFNGLLPAIEKGAAIKIIGAALQAPALAVYTSRPEIQRVADLPGRTVGIGPNLGLLHVTMLGLFSAKGIDPSGVHFVNVGSNAEVYRDIKAGKIDAGVSDVSNMADANSAGLRALPDGRMWRELADYPYQLAYASDRAIRDNRQGIVRILAAYARLFRFLSSPDSLPAYRQARSVGIAGSATRDAAWAHI